MQLDVDSCNGAVAVAVGDVAEEKLPPSVLLGERESAQRRYLDKGSVGLPTVAGSPGQQPVKTEQPQQTTIQCQIKSQFSLLDCAKRKSEQLTA